MKTIIIIFCVTTLSIVYAVTTRLYHKRTKPVVAQMVSMIEGQICYEVPLGERVKKGELVEKLDTRAAHAQVLSDISDIIYSKRIYNDAYQMVQSQSISTEEFCDDKYKFEKAIEQYKIDKDIEKHCSIYAPFDGTVTKVVNYPGSGVGDGNEILEITKTA